MPMDAAVFAALAGELGERLREARLERVIPVNPRELRLTLRIAAPGSRPETTLLLSLDGPLARVHLEDSPPTTRVPVPPFVLLLRRHLAGCRLTAVHHPPWERILHFSFAGPPDEFPRRRFTLVYELLGAQGNLLLLDAQDTVLGSLRPLPPEEQSGRLVLGVAYVLPPRPAADPPATAAYLRQAVALALAETPLRAALLRNLAGLSPWTVRALTAATGIDPEQPCGEVPPEALERLHGELARFAQAVAERRFTPVLWRAGGELKEFWVYPSPAPPGWVPEPQPGALETVAGFFAGRVTAERFAQTRQALRARLSSALAKAERRLHAQREDLTRAEAADGLRRAGEAILANLPRLAKGMSSFTGATYAEPESPLTVALDPRLLPADNAQRYFNRYRKAKRGQGEAAARLQATATLLGQLRLARLEVEDATEESDLAALADELVTEGLLDEARQAQRRTGKGAGGRQVPRKVPPGVSSGPKPRRYRSSDGYEILAGRHSRENDWLTLKSGAPHDLWFHVKDLAGAHVILRLPAEGPLPDEALLEAAQIAAYHSEGRESSQVPVDYTLRRHVRKTPGGRPGQVLYDHHRTLYVTPDPALIARLRAGGDRPDPAR